MSFVEGLAGSGNFVDIILDTGKVIFMMILKAPFNFIRALPDWVKAVSVLILLTLSLVILRWAYKNKDAYLKVRP